MTGAGLRVGLMLATLADPETGAVDAARVIEAAQRAEAAGFDGVYAGDHLAHPRPILESIVALSAVAAATQRVALGPCVLLIALREPLALAKQLTTLAAFAPGRLRVGVGVGGDYPGEFEVAGVPLEGRGRLAEDRLARVRALMSAGLEHAGVSVAPVAPEVPFFFGGRSESALRRAARCGDGWIGYLLDPAAFGWRRARLIGYRDEHGSGGAFRLGMLVPVHVEPAGPAGASAAGAWAKMTAATGGFPERLFAAGRVGEVVERLAQFAEAGCQELLLAPADQGPRYLEQVDILGEEVLPQLRRSA